MFDAAQIDTEKFRAPPAKVAEVAVALLRGASARQAAREVEGVSRTTARKVAVLLNINLRERRPEIIPAEKVAEVVAALDRGLNARQAARETGVSRTKAQRVAHAVRKRSSGVPDAEREQILSALEHRTPKDIAAEFKRGVLAVRRVGLDAGMTRFLTDTDVAVMKAFKKTARAEQRVFARRDNRTPQQAREEREQVEAKYSRLHPLTPREERQAVCPLWEPLPPGSSISRLTFGLALR